MASLLLGTIPIPVSSHSNSLIFSSKFSSFSRSQTLSVSLPSSTVSISVSDSSSTLPFVYCGRGDRRTAKGKRFNHSFGNARPRNKKKGRGPPRAPAPPSAPKKDRFDNEEVIKIDIDESFG